MAYPRNAASPPPVAIGAVVQISDGAVQTTGVTVYHRTSSTTENSGGGTTNVGATTGTIYYTPTQAETNYESFELVAWKTGCIPACVTVVTSASATAGKVVLSGETHTSAVIPTVTTLTGHTAQTGDCYARLGAPAGASHAADVAAVKSDTAAILDDTGTGGVLLANGSIKTGTFNAGAINAAAIAADAIGASELAADAVTEIVAGVWGALTASYTGVGTFGLLLSSTNNAAQTLNGDWTDGQRLDLILDAIKTKTDYLPSATAGASGGVFIAGSNAATTVNITGTVSGNSTHSAADVVTALGTGSTLTALAPASTALSTAVWTNTKAGYIDAAISTAGGGTLTAADIADAVWDELATGHIDAGKAGAQLWTVINTLSSGSAINITSTNTVIESE